MDAIDYITDDHERFRGMLDSYEELDADDHAGRRELADELIAGLVQHAVMEEEALYPFVMARIPDLEHDVREEREEHHIIEVLMKELTELEVTNPQFDAKLEVLAENLLHHFEEEEEELFPRLRDELETSELADLVDDLRAARENASTEPDPNRVGG
jgi:hemerythrin superfamily protein